MTIEDLLTALTIVPSVANPTPGFSPVTRRQGPALLDTFEPETETQRALVERARPIFGTPTSDEYLKFRVALYLTYVEQGFTRDELQPFFPDWELPV